MGSLESRYATIRVQPAASSELVSADWVAGEVQRSYPIAANVPISSLWPVRLIPHPSDNGRYDLRVQATFTPESDGPGQGRGSDAILITGRPLAGARVILASAGTLLMTILGFFGLSIHTALPWVWGLIRGGQKADNGSGVR